MQVKPHNAMSAPGTQSQAAHAMAPRNRSDEAKAALHFWQALEYLAPQSPPDICAAQFVWEMDANSTDATMPWRDAIKQKILKKAYPHWRFQIFSGIAAGDALIEEAREALGAPPLDLSEQKPPAPAACVVLEVNGEGMATGGVFVSTVPWAMARIVDNAGTLSPIDFRGFLGIRGQQKEICRKVIDLLVERRLLLPVPLGEADVPITPDGVCSDANELRPMNAGDIEAVTSLVFHLCDWHPSEQLRWRIKGIKAPENADERKTSDDPLNSFYAEDLERVGDALARDNIGAGLRAYLQGEDTPGRIDLERDVAHLIDGVHPNCLPHGCWPATHPLVTAQQFAVNTTMRELSACNGIFSVNGPPGTGKTTMLKDIVAAIVVRRADVLVSISDPESAFKGKLEIDDYPYTAYVLAERLRGFGMVVASANNGAVENISKELPGLNAIAPDIDLDYFSVVADSLGAPEKAKRRGPTQQHWGLPAAVLGNKSNRARFASQFWFADTAVKKAQPGDAQQSTPAPDPLRLRSLQSLVRDGDHGALPWEVARARYTAAQENVRNLIDLAAGGANALREIDAATQRKQCAAKELEDLVDRKAGLAVAIAAAVGKQASAEQAVARVLAQRQACNALAHAQELVARSEAELAAWRLKLPEGGPGAVADEHTRAAQRCRALDLHYDQHMARRPGLLAQIFRTTYSKRWNASGDMLEQEIGAARANEQATHEAVSRAQALGRRIADLQAAAQSVHDKLQRARAAAQSASVAANATVTTLEHDYLDCQKNVATQKQAVSTACAAADTVQRAIKQCHAVQAGADAQIAQQTELVDALKLDMDAVKTWRLAQLDRHSRHQVAPYAMAALFDARREVFVAAMELHKAFIVASWRKLRPTLSAFINLLTGAIDPAQVAKGSTHLWDAFFLVVPLASTTFASFPRLFAGIGREQLAWLLIDEAGQAAPQQAVGAIWRCARSVVVGDPLQLEPVVGVPKEIVAPLLVRCAAEQQWAPPAASAQVLADRANRHGTYLGGLDDERRVWLGSPLVVHRRCLDPMFGIANSIAYDGMMVYGAGIDNGETGIGPSYWLDIPATQSEGHWIASQGNAALALVQEITNGMCATNGQHKVYLITPFKNGCRKNQGTAVPAVRTEKQRHVRYSPYLPGQGSGARHFSVGRQPQQPRCDFNLRRRKAESRERRRDARQAPAVCGRRSQVLDRSARHTQDLCADG
jgi:hypothetical protein